MKEMTQEQATLKYMPWLAPPESITVEIMTVCNLQCSHCYLYNSEGATRQIMEYSRFESICERLSGLIATASPFNFASVEALVHPRLFDMIDLVHGMNPAIRMPIYSNGMLLTPDKAENPRERGIRELHVSLDGCSRETVEAFKTGSDFGRITGNIEAALRGAGGRLRISTIFVAHRRNIHELPLYVDFCASLGISSINVTGFISYNSSMVDEPLYSLEGVPAVDEIFRLSQEKAQKAGIALSCPSTRLRQRDFSCLTCRILYVTEDGGISPCNLLARPTTLCWGKEVATTQPISYGSIFETPAEALWTSPGYALFRKLFNNGSLPTPCRLCPMAYGAIC